MRSTNLTTRPLRKPHCTHVCLASVNVKFSKKKVGPTSIGIGNFQAYDNLDRLATNQILSQQVRRKLQGSEAIKLVWHSLAREAL